MTGISLSKMEQEDAEENSQSENGASSNSNINVQIQDTSMDENEFDYNDQVLERPTNFDSNEESDEEDQFSKHFIKIERVSEKIKEKSRESTSSFQTPNGWKWCLIVYFAGYESKEVAQFISAYLELQTPNVESKVKFRIDILHPTTEKLLSQIQPRPPYSQCGILGDNKFGPTKDWGFRELIDKNYFAENLIAKDDSATFVVHILPITSDYLDPKKRTGMVGLSNQGATCYLNSLLQTLYHTRSLRHSVYSLDTSLDKAEVGVALELQRLFADLQNKDTAVGTQNLTKAFGWTDNQVFTQHDIQELLRELLDKLGERMKGTNQENVIKDLFCGQYITYVKCINVDCETSRQEDFFDLQLDVRGLRSVQESFTKYVQEEKLEGDNQYDAENFGKQDAMKGVKFKKFPPVLHLHLKRFAYDINTDRTFKIHDRYEFPELLSLNEYIKDQAIEDYTYVLHSVLVHSGNDQRGHYYAFVRVNDTKHPKGRWYKFNDESVTKVKKETAISDTFGTGPIYSSDGTSNLSYSLSDQNSSFTHKYYASEPSRSSRFIDSNASAYMLVYVREQLWDTIMCPPQPVPKHLLERFEEDAKNKQNAKEEQERSRHCGIMKVATMQHLQRFEFCTPRSKEVDDWVDWSIVDEVEYGDIRFAKCHSVYTACAEKYKLILGHFRVWKTCSRRNDTLRLDEILEDSDQPIPAYFNRKIFLETSTSELETLLPKEISLMFRKYDPTTSLIVPGQVYFFSKTNLINEVSLVKDLWSFLARAILNEDVDEVVQNYDIYELTSLTATQDNVKKIKYDESSKLSERISGKDGNFFNIECAGDLFIFSKRSQQSFERDCQDYFNDLIQSYILTCTEFKPDLSDNSASKDIELTVHESNPAEKVVQDLAARIIKNPNYIRISVLLDSTKRFEKGFLALSDYSAPLKKVKRSNYPPSHIMYDIIPCSRNELQTEKSYFQFVFHLPHNEYAEEREREVSNSLLLLSNSSSSLPSNSIAHDYQQSSFTLPSSMSISKVTNQVKTRYDVPTVFSLLIDHKDKSCEVLFRQAQEQVLQKGNQKGFEGNVTEISLYIVSGNRIERILSPTGVIDEAIKKCIPTGFSILVSEDGKPCPPEGKFESRLFGHLLRKPIISQYQEQEVCEQKKTRLVKVSVVHCTCKDDGSQLTEIGLPTVAFIMENENLGPFWKRLLRDLEVPSDLSYSWRPALAFDRNKIIALDLKDVEVPTMNGHSENVGTSNGHIVGSNVFRPPKRARIAHDDYDSIPLWNRPDFLALLSNDRDIIDPAQFLVYIRHSPSSIPGRTASPMHSLTIRSS